MIDEKAEGRWDDDLKAQERIFCLHYCTNESTRFNATSSYRETYKKIDKESGKYIFPTKSTCETNGSRMMKKEKIKKAIRMLLQVTQEELDEENVYKALKELWLLSTYNPADILTSEGKLRTKTLSALGEKAKCIAQITPGKHGVKYTLYDRNKAMTQLLDYLNIIRPEKTLDVKLPVIEMVRKAISPEAWNEQQQNANKGE